MRWKIAGGIVLMGVLTLGIWQTGPGRAAARSAQQPAGGAPSFQVDPSWPKTEGNWIFGSIGGITVDPTNDHVWVVQRPRTLDKNENYAAQRPPAADCCVPARHGV
jgi:hypothetical protein